MSSIAFSRSSSAQQLSMNGHIASGRRFRSSGGFDDQTCTHTLPISAASLLIDVGKSSEAPLAPFMKIIHDNATKIRFILLTETFYYYM
jgi:hypothetical protein